MWMVILFIRLSLCWLVSIPGQAVDGEWDYSVEVSCKFDKEDTADSSVSRKVQKVWKDDGNKEKRPENITVQHF